MRKNKVRILSALALLILVLMSVGYAALSTNLNINGTASVAKAGWSVYFTGVSVTSGSVSATTAPTASGTSTTSLTYSVALTEPGDFYEFTVQVKNAGTLAAKLNAAPTLSGLSTAQDVYTNYTVTYSDGTAIKAGDTIAAGASKTLKVRVEYDSSISASQLPTSAQTLTLTCTMNYVQA
ncbi:MAG: hypothetical protein IJ475_01745 [Bacilli bacterium]|nr:hypothetical protein [Bacilli bacterium]